MATKLNNRIGIAVGIGLPIVAGAFLFFIRTPKPLSLPSPSPESAPVESAPAASIAAPVVVVPAIRIINDDTNIDAMIERCAPSVASSTLKAVITVESAQNPYAIGVVGARLERQPETKDEALATVLELERQGYNFSLGYTQVNRHNLEKYGETYETIFESCTNIRTGAAILGECYGRAKTTFSDDQQALRAALSCYYSGNFTRGHQKEDGKPSYVSKVIAASDQAPPVPAIVATASTGTKPTAPAPEKWVFLAEEEAPPAPAASTASTVPTAPNKEEPFVRILN